MAAIVALICISPKDTSMCFLSLYNLFGEVSAQIFSPIFKIRCLCSFLVVRVLYIF